MGKLYFSKPEIQEEKGKFRLSVNIHIDYDSGNKRDEELYYEVSKEDGQYLYDDRIDPFFIAVLPYCMKNNLNIEVADESGVSAEIVFKVREKLLHMIHYIDGFETIKIKTNEIKNPVDSGDGVGTGVSRGLDSMFTIFSEKDSITDFFLFNTQAYGVQGGEKAREQFMNDYQHARVFIEDYNAEYGKKCKLHFVDSNIHEVLHISIGYAGSYRDIAAMVVMKKLVGIYLFSATYTLNDFGFKSCRYHEGYLCQIFCTKNHTIMQFGEETSRLNKAKFVSEYRLSYDYLSVCRSYAYAIASGKEYTTRHLNCTCDCEKCRYTVMELYLSGKLDKYRNVFDVDWVNEHIEELFNEVKEKKDKEYFDELYKELEKDNWIGAV